MDWFTVRARDEATDHWFEVNISERRMAVDLARALDASADWSMVSVARDTKESIDWRAA